MDYGNFIVSTFDRTFLSMCIRDSITVYITIEKDALGFILWVSRPKYSKVAFVIKPKKIK